MFGEIGLFQKMFQKLEKKPAIHYFSDAIIPLQCLKHYYMWVKSDKMPG